MIGILKTKLEICLTVLIMFQVYALCIKSHQPSHQPVSRPDTTAEQLAAADAFGQADMSKEVLIAMIRNMPE